MNCEEAKVNAEKDNIETALNVNAEKKTQDINSKKLKIPPTKFQDVEWVELIPQSDLDALLNPPEYIMQIEDGSIEDRISSTIQNAIEPKQSVENVYEQALVSTNIIETMDGKNIRIPGFIVPVEFGEEKTVTKFFLVPFFGACLHMPPPPPNQIIYVEAKGGVALESLYDPVVIEGKLSVELFEDQIATSAYTMQLENLAIYDEGY